MKTSHTNFIINRIMASTILSPSMSHLLKLWPLTSMQTHQLFQMCAIQQKFALGFTFPLFFGGVAFWKGQGDALGQKRKKKRFMNHNINILDLRSHCIFEFYAIFWLNVERHFQGSRLDLLQLGNQYFTYIRILGQFPYLVSFRL